MRYKYSIRLATLTLLLVIIYQPVVDANEAFINVDNLNVRNGPGTDYDTIGQVHSDSSFTVLRTEEEWVQIELQEGTGWVNKAFISFIDEETRNSDVSTEDGEEESDTNSMTSDRDKETMDPSLNPVEENQTITIGFDRTHIRNGPSTDYEITHYVDKGTEFNIVAETDEWYELENDSIRGYILKKLIEGPKVPSTSEFMNKTIVIDAGHGGRDVGAIGVNDTYEKNLTYKTAVELAQELSMLGAEVILTRQKDEYIFLSSRSSMSNNSNTDAFISIHYNSVPEIPNATGIGTYYYQDQYQELAEYVQKGIIKETNARDRDSTFGNFQVIRQNYQPSILLELGFMSNSEEEKLLLTNAYQKKIVSGIVNGLGKYFSSQE